MLRTSERVAIIRVARNGRLLPVEKANEGLVHTDRVEIASVLGETQDRLRVGKATSIVEVTELGNAEGWIEEPWAEVRLRGRPRPGVVMRSS